MKCRTCGINLTEQDTAPCSTEGCPLPLGEWQRMTWPQRLVVSALLALLSVAVIVGAPWAVGRTVDQVTDYKMRHERSQ